MSCRWWRRWVCEGFLRAKTGITAIRVDWWTTNQCSWGLGLKRTKKVREMSTSPPWLQLQRNIHGGAAPQMVAGDRSRYPCKCFHRWVTGCLAGADAGASTAIRFLPCLHASRSNVRTAAWVGSRDLSRRFSLYSGRFGLPLWLPSAFCRAGEAPEQGVLRTGRAPAVVLSFAAFVFHAPFGL